jgi:transposase
LDILTLHRKGLRQRAIERKLGISRNTLKKYIENPELVLIPEKPRRRKSQLDPFQDNMEAWLNEDDYTATCR